MRKYDAEAVQCIFLQSFLKDYCLSNIIDYQLLLSFLCHARGYLLLMSECLRMFCAGKEHIESYSIKHQEQHNKYIKLPIN